MLIADRWGWCRIRCRRRGGTLEIGTHGTPTNAARAYDSSAGQQYAPELLHAEAAQQREYLPGRGSESNPQLPLAEITLQSGYGGLWIRQRHIHVRADEIGGVAPQTRFLVLGTPIEAVEG